MSDLGLITNIEDYASHVLAANKRWAQRLHQTFPLYFPDPKDKQAPKILWIGCSDSRVQDSDATTALPGNIFVHRNIANQFHLDDDNALSVLTYAVKALGVQHIVVVGHEHCGGAYTALKRATSEDHIGRQYTLCDSLYHFVESIHKGHLKHAEEPNDAITRWLTPLVNRIKEIKESGELPEEEEEALRVVIDENVKLQVGNIVQLNDEWVHNTTEWKPVWVHGWVYDFSTGFIRDLEITKELGYRPQEPRGGA